LSTIGLIYFSQSTFFAQIHRPWAHFEAKSRYYRSFVEKKIILGRKISPEKYIYKAMINKRLTGNSRGYKKQKSFAQSTKPAFK